MPLGTQKSARGLNPIPNLTDAPTVGREGRRALAPVASFDSDLEAFSHNPAHGSFVPLAFQPSAMTNCVNQRFLSYLVELLTRHGHQ